MPQQTSNRRRSATSSGSRGTARSASSGTRTARSSSGGSRPATATILRAGSSIRENDLAHLRVDELRDQLRKRGVTGTSNLRKPDLIKSLARAMRRGTPARAQQASRPKAGSPAARKSTSQSARKSTASARKSTSSARKSASSGARRSPSSSARKSASSSARRSASSGGRKSASSSSRKSASTSGARSGAAGGSIRTGPSSSRSLNYAQRIDGPQQHAERPGRSLVTTNRAVIKKWAQARGGSPATVGAPRDGRPSVLRIDFPGYGGANLRPISWDEWFATFDERRLNFIYQEQRTDGTPSNFFRLESPHREDA
ncbi:hypothetical protein O7623_24650 [Solwaraspora sp. WMMD791]|uniref:hypothetical protein n=1 Tax=Solwaraspora sp. WMMD791 TaxID=3016086 RepID=UPI00249AB817|nr:hypothetical protein [Solwaraspora sp. WMMD791]WFE26482.1 hypothetical protein O7623_24650 [Solwaraspora sp. WMMD791]